MNTDERRALKILYEKHQDDDTLAERFMDYLRKRTSTERLTPEQIARRFEIYEEAKSQEVNFK